MTLTVATVFVMIYSMALTPDKIDAAWPVAVYSTAAACWIDAREKQADVVNPGTTVSCKEMSMHDAAGQW
ncbi:MAG: hypothetical protein KGL39_30770 [Patescibacteria group bacterium]|nr:hypothetical protein [Patescibacteria group bacterium]